VSTLYGINAMCDALLTSVSQKRDTMPIPPRLILGCGAVIPTCEKIFNLKLAVAVQTLLGFVEHQILTAETIMR